MKTTSLTIATILILVLSDRSDATDPQPASEAWYVYVNKEVNYASEHVTKRTLADGNIEYRIESRTLVDLLGSRQEESAKATYVVASDLSPVSINALTMRPSGEVRIVVQSRENTSGFAVKRTG